jgi:beta-lactam-binding protein with PASTA domain
MATSGPSPGIAGQVGRVLSDRYRLVAPIGTGASAQVHLADDLRLGRRVAVKLLHPALATDESFLRRFRAEARAAAALSHPNIMAVYDWGDDAGDGPAGVPGHGPFLVLELLSGGSLRAMLDTGARLSVSQALVLGLEAGRALDAAHRRGFVHRDIKPANLLFGEDGRLRVADFGLARALSEAAWTEPGDGLIGTARYAAPEQASGVRVDGKADVYSLALVLIEAVTGSVPSVADSALATVKLRADGAVAVPDEMGALQPILAPCLVPDPAERPDAATLVQSLLDAARNLDRPAPLPLVGLGVATDDATVAATALDDDVTVLPARPLVDPTIHAPAAVVPDAEPARGRRWWRVLLVALVVLGFAAGAFFAWRSAQAPTAPVPSVAGQTVDDATAAIKAAETDDVQWKVDTKDEYSDGVAPGVVIRTDPPQGSKLAGEKTITLVVSQGPTPVPLPDLSTADEASATAAIEAAQLKVGKVTPEYSETIPAGKVTGWSVNGEEKPEKAPKGSSVDIRISKGPEPRTIPTLKGAPQADAQNELTKLGFTVKVVEDFSDDVGKGLTIGTDPPAGAKAPKGAEITLHVSKGQDLVAVPDVVGMSYSDAYDTLTNAGFVFEQKGQGNVVVRTDPPPGKQVKRGSTVTVTLRR